jgi:hypothetical protein
MGEWTRSPTMPLSYRAIPTPVGHTTESHAFSAYDRRMPDRIEELLAAIMKLEQRSEELLQEHRELTRQARELRQELRAIRDNAAARRQDEY